MKQSEKEQAYSIDKVFQYMKKNNPSLIKDDIRYWNISQTKILRKYELMEKVYIQILSADEDKVFLSFSECGNCIRFYKSQFSIEQLDKILC